MEILKGGLIAVARGVLISLVLAFLVAAATVYYSSESGWIASIGLLVRRTIGVTLAINLVMAPASFVVGLVFAGIRSAVRQGVQEGVLDAADSPGS